MAKTPKTVKIKETPAKPHGQVPSEVLQDQYGLQDTDVVDLKLAEISELLWHPEGAREEEKEVRIVRALELYESLEPSGGAEGMLATQMVGTHFAATECLRRAAISNQTIEGRDVNLKHAQKLMALYGKQLETLNKHRGKGQQKVTVKHVNVAPGGEAIVGNVETGARAKENTSPKQVSHTPETPPPAVEEWPREKVSRKGRSS